VICRGSVVLRDDLPFADLLREREAAPPGPDGSLNDALEALERRMLQEALAQAAFNQSQAARLLGLNERMLRYKLRKYGLK